MVSDVSVALFFFYSPITFWDIDIGNGNNIRRASGHFYTRIIRYVNYGLVVV